jgi:hypothetical protein
MRAVALLTAALITWLPAAADGQTITPRQRVVLQLIDLNGDDLISSDELLDFLQKALSQRAVQAGLAVGPNRTTFDRYVRSVRDSALNGSSADGDDTISPAELAALERVTLPPPFGGTMKDLLPAVPKQPEKPSWTGKLSDWLDIRQSFLDDQQIGKPAKISLTNHAPDDETVDEGKARRVWAIDASAVLDGFVEWNPHASWYVRPIVGYEMHLSSDAPAKDQVVHRVGLQTDVTRDASKTFESHSFRATFDYSTDRSYKATVFGATAEYSPNATRLGIGRYLGHGKSVDFRWRPYVGFVSGHVRSAGGVSAYADLTDFFHEFVRLTGEVKIGSRGLITPEITIWHGKRTDEAGAVTHWQQLSSLDARLVLSESEGKERASVGVSFKLGRESPDFKKEKEFVLALAFKF